MSSRAEPDREDPAPNGNAAEDRRAAGPVPSPCINVCRMSPATGLCEGCLRTIDEIAAWSTLSDEGKHAVWDAIEQRRGELFKP
jgi:predicted Fe-S protein YdhL (DUF1289 family)